MFDPLEPAPLGFYYEIELRIYDIMWRCLARAMPHLLGAGHFSSVCGTFIGSIHHKAFDSPLWAGHDQEVVKGGKAF